MLIILFNLLSFYIAVIPNWSLKEVGKDLLSSSTSYYYSFPNRVTENNDEDYTLKMYRTINKTKDNVTYTNYVNVIGRYEIVSFDTVESFYNMGNFIICPNGKKHLYYRYTTGFYIQNGLIRSENWNLKCFHYETGDYLLVSYLNAKDDNFFLFDYFSKKYFKIELSGEELLGYRIKYKSYNQYIFIYFYKSEKNLTVEKAYLTKESKTSVVINNKMNRTNRTITNKLLKNTVSTFKNNTNDFYFITYDDANNFYSGYTNSTFDNNFNINDIDIVVNTQSPFNFLDEVEIKEINFILENKYVYYKLKINNTNKYYHGILDIELNKIIFNTNETINNYIPYWNTSMLAITPETAYKICIYKNDKGCTDYCPEGYIIDTSGSRCGISCPSGQIKLMPEEICNETCDTSINIIKNQECGACEYFDKNSPFKFINGTKCLSLIPEGAELYNNKLSILKCKDGYHFQNDSCLRCYNTCKDCLEISTDENEQKCIKCKANFLFNEGNCLTQCPFGFEKVEDECHRCGNYKCKNFIINSCNCSECNESYYLEGPKCKKCSDNCKDCENSNKCKTCYDKYILENNKCYKCHENCESCFGSSLDNKEQKCLSCKNTSMFLYENNCVNNCSDGFYIYNNNKCKACDKHCKTCEKGEENNNQHCLTCDINSDYKYLIDAKDFGKNCIQECPNETVLEDGKCILNISEDKNSDINNSDDNNDNDKNNNNNDNINKNNDNNSLLIIILSSIIGAILIIIIIILFYRCYKRKTNIKGNDRDVLIQELNVKLEIDKLF